MDKKEFAMFAIAIKTFYPRENILKNEKEIELWFNQLQDIPFKLAEIVLQKWVCLNKWSPAISDIREMAVTVINGEILEWGDAWQEVLNAISKFGSYRADEAIETLSPITKKVIKQIGFTNICLSENLMADRANFRMIYEEISEKERKNAQLPKRLQNLILQYKLIEKGE